MLYKHDDNCSTFTCQRIISQLEVLHLTLAISSDALRSVIQLLESVKWGIHIHIFSYFTVNNNAGACTQIGHGWNPCNELKKDDQQETNLYMQDWFQICLVLMLVAVAQPSVHSNPLFHIWNQIKLRIRISDHNYSRKNWLSYTPASKLSFLMLFLFSVFLVVAGNPCKNSLIRLEVSLQTLTALSLHKSHI